MTPAFARGYARSNVGFINKFGLSFFQQFLSFTVPLKTHTLFLSTHICIYNISCLIHIRQTFNIDYSSETRS
uniref:Uncharacterized protein n=1 Tax=Pararge aegeria TaxID=116150 RepID=S4PWT9_9NEOP